ncbi:neurocalcin homolog [Exaiptasia diaphana]|uniref:EF-hand domain-containing protein n=2 Tax=Exaiptasia diaphana TaxID=2652724 RepID=A0A913YLS4_EXADI|nr:neurocalcin homolog [Exaiptasia diaphana]XP_020902349.1 neurocalcin homolog [Exaiptasia diaphana]XP_028515426.1 neurocalcin homolog [Exaiptasia diaphana]XP_028515427.1 neurocalcin homolog [Exaiptasia diaphana]
MGKKQSKLDPQVMNDLMRRTDFDEKELKSWYKGFLKDCPSGYLTKEQFIEMYNKVFRQGDATKLAACVFRRFDVNRDGKIDFREFMCSLYVSTRGSMEQKLKWAFSIYDINGDGFITKQEMYRIVDALYRTAGDDPTTNKSLVAQWEELDPEERTLKVFRSFDTNRDGLLSLSEFLEGAKKDKTLALILENQSCDF